jgi:hypothetical protein
MGITMSKLMEFYIDTIQKCGTHLLDMDDDYIGYCVFEEFDSGATSFLHSDTLAKLAEANLITETISQKSSILRSKFLELQNTEHWNVESVKSSKRWRDVLELSDEIKTLLAL